LQNYKIDISVSGTVAIELKTESAVSNRGVGIASVSLHGDYADITRYPAPNTPFPTTDTFYTVTGLQDFTTYNYTVSAIGGSSVRMSAINYVTTLPLPIYTISASCGENGSITPIGDTTIVHGGWIAYTILADKGYHLDSLFVNDEIYLDTASLTFLFNNVRKNYTIHAVFAINYYTLSASCGENGTISPVGDTVVQFNKEVTYFITPDENYEVDSVFIDDIYNAEATLNKLHTFSNISGNHTIYATFANHTAVKEKQNNNPLKIYNHHNTIYLANEHNISIQSIKITDMLGRLVYRQNYFTPKIELNLPNSVYIVQITDSNRRISTYKVCMGK
jgi:hypothetical protein